MSSCRPQQTTTSRKLRCSLYGGLGVVTGVHVVHSSVDCDASDLEASQNFAQLQPLSVAAGVVYSNLGGGGSIFDSSECSEFV